MAKYSVVTLEKRTQLINKVHNLGMGVTKIAKKLRIKLSTAKSILRIYRKSGKILPKKSKALNTKKIKRQQRIKQIKQQKQEIILTKVQPPMKTQCESTTPSQSKSINNYNSNHKNNFQQQQHLIKIKKQLELQLFYLASRYQMERMRFGQFYGFQPWLIQSPQNDFNQYL